MLDKKSFFKNTFIHKDAKEFSKTSGDFNCIHLDQEFASKSIHGKRVVHGMNAVFWALECFFMRLNNNTLISIDIKFMNPIFFKQLVYLEIVKMTFR